MFVKRGIFDIIEVTQWKGRYYRGEYHLWIRCNAVLRVTILERITFKTDRHLMHIRDA